MEQPPIAAQKTPASSEALHPRAALRPPNGFRVQGLGFRVQISRLWAQAQSDDDGKNTNNLNNHGKNDNCTNAQIIARRTMMIVIVIKG